jgi:hypothetical protein
MKKVKSSPHGSTMRDRSREVALLKQYQLEMQKLVSKKRSAWARGNVKVSEKISARMRVLLQKERDLGSGVGIVIRT